jgi:predicted permease
MASLLYDLRYALRQMRNARVFSLTVILVLALGIGANTAVFTLVHAVLLKSLPVTKPEQLFRVGDSNQCCVNGGLEGSWSLFSYAMYRHFRDNTPAFEQLAAFAAGLENMGLRRIDSGNPAQAVSGEFVSGNYFQMFGISAYAGRVFNAGDDGPGEAPIAVLSYRTWQDRYGGDRRMIGAAVAVNGQPFTIVGVAPPRFFGDALRGDPPEIWIPLSFEPQVHGSNSILKQDYEWLDLTGRVSPHTSVRQVEAHLTAELRQLLLQPGAGWSEQELKQVPEQVIRLTPGGAGVQWMRDEYEDSLKVLLWVTGFVLLIACANLANLMLARTAARRQEISIRSALGASRTRLIRHTFFETLLLSLVGGVVGLLVAMNGTKFILHLAFPNRYVPIDATPSGLVLGFAFALSVVTGFLFGMVPVWLISRAQPVDALRVASRATDTRGHWVQRSLVILQAALSLVLICAAGLVVESLRNLSHQHFGFETQGRYIVDFDPTMAGYKVGQLDNLYHQIRDGLQEIPGVQSVSYAQYTPMSGNNWEAGVNIDGGHHSDQDYSVFVRVGPGYFDAIGTRVLQGRAITEQDTATARPVAVINHEFMKRYFEGKNALGHHIGQGGAKHAADLEIVGVTEDANYWGPDEPIRPMFFTAAPQEIKQEDAGGTLSEERSMYLGNIILRTAGAIPDLEKQVRRAMGNINPDLPVIAVVPFAQQVQRHLDQQQMIAQLMTIFGLLALILATVGLYGVTAYGVERRTGEIGIRVALGAGRLSVLRMVMRTAALQSAAGLAIGLPLVFAAGRVLASKLFGVSTFNLAVLSIAILGLILSALIAGFIPARRAASIDPMQALRAE